MRCSACGAINVRSRPACHHCDAPLLLDEPTQGQAKAGPNDPHAPVVALLGPAGDPTADDWPLSFRSVLRPTSANRPDSAAGTGPDGSEDTAPMALQRGPQDTTPARLAPTPETPAAEPLPDKRPACAPAVPAPAPPQARAAGPAAPATPPAAPDPEAKAQRRALVRRSQLRRRQAGQADAGDAPCDVLLLEADADSRTVLREVLGLFGFRAHVAISVAEAEGMCARRGFAVALLGLGRDAEAAAELCRRLHDTRRRRPLALIAMADATRHADRVRMQLAGADATLTRPVNRGGLARALEACGVRLPTDPREGGAPAR